MSEPIVSTEDTVQKAEGGSAAPRAKALHQLVRDALNHQMRLHPAPRMRRAAQRARLRQRGREAMRGGFRERGSSLSFSLRPGAGVLLSILTPKQRGWLEDDCRAERRPPSLRGRSIAAGVFPCLRAALDAANGSDNAV